MVGRRGGGGEGGRGRGQINLREGHRLRIPPELPPKPPPFCSTVYCLSAKAKNQRKGELSCLSRGRIALFHSSEQK